MLMESMRAPDSLSEKASMHDVLDADKTSLFRSVVARLNFWAVDRPYIQRAVRVQTCGKIREGMSKHGDHVTVANSTKQTHCAMRQ